MHHLLYTTKVLKHNQVCLELINEIKLKFVCLFVCGLFGLFIGFPHQVNVRATFWKFHLFVLFPGYGVIEPKMMLLVDWPSSIAKLSCFVCPPDIRVIPGKPLEVVDGPAASNGHTSHQGNQRRMGPKYSLRDQFVAWCHFDPLLRCREGEFF